MNATKENPLGPLPNFRATKLAPHCRSQNDSHDEFSEHYGLKCEDKSLAQQNMRDETDINFIVKKMGLGVPPVMTSRIPMQGDFEDADDFRTSLQRIREAELAFSQLPAHARAEFNNDPAELIAFVEGDHPVEEWVRLGLAVPRPPEAPKDGPKAEDAPK